MARSLAGAHTVDGPTPGATKPHDIIETEDLVQSLLVANERIEEECKELRRENTRKDISMDLLHERLRFAETSTLVAIDSLKEKERAFSDLAAQNNELKRQLRVEEVRRTRAESEMQELVRSLRKHQTEAVAAEDNTVHAFLAEEEQEGEQS